MRFLVAVVAAALAFAGAARASDLHVASLQAAEDVSLPFSCVWGYDWEERCYRDDGARLSIGGEHDKAWRSALRFSTASLPAGATVVTAELALWYDRVCIAPQDEPPVRGPRLRARSTSDLHATLVCET